MEVNWIVYLKKNQLITDWNNFVSLLVLITSAIANISSGATSFIFLFDQNEDPELREDENNNTVKNIISINPFSYTHLKLPTNREV